MKQLFLTMALALYCLSAYVDGAEPNYVKSVTMNVDGSNSNVVSYSYTDGLGREIQNKVRIDATKDLVTCVFFDDAGRPVKATKPFVDGPVTISPAPPVPPPPPVPSPTLGKYLPGSFDDINNILKAQYSQYNDATAPAPSDPYAYTETNYYNDPLSRAKESFPPGATYRKNNASVYNLSRSWVFALDTLRNPVDITVIVRGSNHTFQILDGFIVSPLPSDSITVEKLDKMYEYCLANDLAAQFPNGRKIVLSVNRDASGKFTQSLTDLFGRTFKSRALLGTGVLISKSEYDILGNLLNETPPDNGTEDIDPSVYSYNTLGQILTKKTPDGTLVKYKYNDAGLLEEVNYMKPNTVNTSLRNLIYRYDDLQRIKEITKLQGGSGGGGFITLQLNYYGDEMEELETKYKQYGITPYIMNNLKNCRGRQVAAIVPDTDNPNKFIVDLFSYTEEGNIALKVKIIPGLPIQYTYFTYDIHGKITGKRMYCGDVLTKQGYFYDALGRLDKVFDSSNTVPKEIVSNSYTDYGKLRSKTLNGNIPRNYTYSILDQVESMTGDGTVPISGAYEEDIVYKIDGNIDSTANRYGSTVNKTIKQKYTYDGLNRLTGVTELGSTTTVGEHVANFTYDNLGRFLTKQENTTKPTIANYRYFKNNSRLKGAKAASRIDYLYDFFGNLVVDKTKKLIIEYDWRDLPVKFRFYDSIPSVVIPAPLVGGIGGESDGAYKIDISGYTKDLYGFMNEKVLANEIKLLSTVTMAYDASGNRVLKLESK
jgi:YD repeat-containing protein